MASIDDARRAVLTAVEGYLGSYPEAPWGDCVYKVDKKIFLFLGTDTSKLSLSMKLPTSSLVALELPQAKPTGYGMGKHGWVAMVFRGGDDAPVDDLVAWIDESYRVVAKKGTIKRWDAGERNPPRPEPAPFTGETVLLVGNDPIRLQRAIPALEARGIEPICVGLAEAVDVAGEAVPDAVVVDLCKDATDAMQVLASLSVVAAGVPHVAVGVRDAKMERTLRDRGTTAQLCREAPGDAKSLALMFGAFTK